MENKPIKVLIVDDSRVARELINHIVQTDPNIKVVGNVASGIEALQWLQSNTCDVITMDIHMPDLNGFEATKRIMATHPIPIVIISSYYTKTDKEMSFRALEAGALGILEKPIGFQDVIYNEKVKELIQMIKTISEVKTIKRINKNKDFENTSLIKKHEKHFIKAIGIGASFGGPLAICKILSELPPSFPVPIFIVQHIALGFTESFADWLQGHSKLKIYVAADKQKAAPGCVYIAADNCQMEVKKGGVISLLDMGQEKRQPTIGTLFKSMCDAYGANCAGVILTGMGSDGAKELLFMKEVGAYTIAQDEESCLIFGIPKMAVSIGAARHVLPLDKIASILYGIVSN